MKKGYILVTLFLIVLYCIFADAVLADMIKKPVVTNVSSDRFTVSWMTTASERAEIYYGMIAPFNDVAYDERGKSYKGESHSITVTGVKTTSTYYYDIVSGDIRYDNGGKHYMVTTGPVLSPTIDSDIAYDQVFQKVDTIKTPVKDAIAYISLEDKDGLGSSGKSQQCSSLINDDGYWHVDLKNIRTEDLSSYFDYTKSKDKLIVKLNDPEGADLVK